MPKLQGKTSTIFQLRVSHQGSSSNGSREDSIDARVRALENSVAELQIYLLQTLELRSYALQILHHMGLHPQPPPTTPSTVTTTLISDQRVNSIDVRVRAIENFMAERENFVAELQSYVSQISHHFGLHPQSPTSHQPENSTNGGFRAIEKSIAEVRGYLLQFLHNLGLHPQPPPAP